MLANQTITIGDSLLIALVGIAVVLIELALLAVIIMLLYKGARDNKAAVQPVETPQVIPIQAAPAAVTAPPAVIENGILLVDTDEQTAAMLMAIVSDQTGIPLERLHFQSIRQVTVDSKTQAVLLAIISDKTGIPADRLIIKSIKAID